MKKKDLVFATNNLHKLSEVQQIGSSIRLLTLNDIGCKEELPETSTTIEGNASQKAHYVFEQYRYDCFADDTGLEVHALGGAPGVYSARYAGVGKSSSEHIELLLKNLKGVKDRRAQFRTCISLIINGAEHLFEGIAKGRIREERSGHEGFGYDPVFEPEGHTITFAEMSMGEKNAISHRGKAVKKLVAFLRGE